MKIFLVMLTWMAMALLLVAGVVMAAKGSFWLIAAGLAGFVFAVAKIGCLSR
jgi:hypothetical protein